MLRSTYTVNIGSKKVEFELQEQLFQLEEPTKVTFQNEKQCIVCDKTLKNNHKNTCQFCGHKACEKCAYKLRVFANQNKKLVKCDNLDLSQIQQSCKMGRVCRICDRKFFLRATFQKYAAKASVYVQKSLKLNP